MTTEKETKIFKDMCEDIGGEYNAEITKVRGIPVLTAHYCRIKPSVIIGMYSGRDEDIKRGDGSMWLMTRQKQRYHLGNVRSIIKEK